MRIKPPRPTLILALLGAALSAFAQGNGSAQARLSGKRLILEGSRCAGWSFQEKNVVLRYDEVLCQAAGSATFAARAAWSGSNSFLIVENAPDGTSPTTPPRVWMYKLGDQGTRLTLHETWLGWGERQPSKETYLIRSP